MARAALEARIGRIAGARVVGLAPLSGGCVGDVFRADLASGARVVVKAGGGGSRLDVEGDMLRALARADLPVPKVIFAARFPSSSMPRMRALVTISPPCSRIASA